jgi:hypothetical protein
MYCKIKANLNRIFNKARLQSFFYGPFYPIYVALFTALFFVAKIPLLGLFTFATTALIVFLRFRDATPIIPLLLFVVLIFRDFDVMSGPWGYVALSPAIIGFIAKFFVHPIKSFKMGKLFFPLLLVCYALFLGGFFCPLGNYASGISVMITVGPTMLVIYLFFSNYICPPDNFKTKKFMCYILVIMGLTVALQFIIYRLHIDILKDNEFKTASIGWCNINGAGTLFLLAIPCCWYLMSKVKNTALFASLLLPLYVGTILSNSAGITFFSFIFTPVLAFFCYKKMAVSHHQVFVKTTLIVIAVIVVSLIVLVSIYTYDNILLELGFFFSTSSRLDLYEEAVDLFAKHPIFGVGLGYVGNAKLEHTGLNLYNFHSVILHVMTTMGVFGTIAYIIYYITRFKILMHSGSTSSLFLTIAFIMFECYALIDTAEFNAIPLMTTLTVMITVVECTNNKGNANALPFLF